MRTAFSFLISITALIIALFLNEEEVLSLCKHLMLDPGKTLEIFINNTMPAERLTLQIWLFVK